MAVGNKATAYLTVEDQSGPGLQRFQANIRKAGDAVAGLGGTVSRGLGAIGLATGGIAATGAALLAFSKNAVDSEAALDDLSESTSLSVEFLDKLQQVATRGGHSFESITNAAGKFSDSVAKARGGNKELLELFQGLGISLEDLRRQNIDELFERTAKAIGTATDSATANSYATGLMGKSARELAPVFADIIERGLGFARVTAQMAADADKAQKALNQSKLRLEELSLVLGGALAERINAVSDALDRASRSGESFAATFGNVFRAIVSGSELSQARKQFDDAAGQIVELRGKLAELDKPVAARTAGSQAIADRLRAGIEAKLREAEAARDVAVQAINRLESKEAKPGKTNVLPPRPDGAGAGAATGGRGPDLFEQRRQALIQELQRTQQLTAVEEVLADVQTGRLTKINAAQRDVLIGLAAQVDLAKENATVQKEAQDATERSAKAAADAILRENERLERSAQAWRDLIDPTEEYRRKIAEIAELVNRGKLTPEEGDIAFERETMKINEALIVVGETAKETNDIARELGLTFSSAAEDALVEWKGFGDVLKGIEKDLLRLGTRKLVSEPALGWFDELIKKSSGGGGIAGILGGLFSGGGGGLNLSSFGAAFAAEGAMTRAGQQFIVGERGPELFVAPSAGQIVPNNALGGGPINITVNVPADTSRSSSQQIAAEVGRAVSRATRRNT